MADLGALLDDSRTNVVLSWALAGFLLLVFASQLLVGSFLWAGFVAAVVGLVLVPPVAYRSVRAMLPWEVVLLASLPVVGRALVAGRTVGGVPLTGRVATYVAVAAIALIVAVELDTFTPVRMNVPFAVLFVVVATMASAGLWAVVQWLSDRWLGTAFLLGRGPPEAVETALMWDFVAATFTGLVGGLVFEFYFRRQVPSRERLPEGVGDATSTSPGDAASTSPGDAASTPSGTEVPEDGDLTGGERT